MPPPIFSSSDYEKFWRSELEKVHPAGAHHIRAACPVHGGDSPDTLSVNLENGHGHCFKCHSDGESWSMYQFAMAKHGFSEQCARDYVNSIIGIVKKPTVAPWRWSFPKPLAITDNEWRLGILARRIQQFEDQYNAEVDAETGLPDPSWEAYALYLYPEILSVKVRLRNKRTGKKKLVWLALTDKGGWSRPGKLDRKAPPYRAATLKDAKEIWLLNGEKAVDRAVADWGVTATCLPNGEANWSPDYLPYFQNAQVVYIVTDNDAQGRKHGAKVGGLLAHAGVQARVVELPDVPEKADLYDFIEMGGTLERCLGIAALAPVAIAVEPPVAQEKHSRNGHGGSNGDGPPDEPPVEVLTGQEPDLLPFEMNDTGNADRLAAVAGDRLRFIPTARNWIAWSQDHWELDESEVVIAAAKHTMRLLKQQANAQREESVWKFANKNLNAAGLKNMVSLARELRSIDINEFDSHHNLIACKNGTFDLDTGELREHRKEDYITRLFPHNYDPKLGLPQLSLRTLDELMGGGPDASEEDLQHATEMIEYFQRLAGYLLTGYTTEKAFFCFWGETGNNGKTLILQLLCDILGPYAVRIDPLTLTASSRQGDSNKKSDMARMKGARLAVASEPPGNEKFDQGVLKLLTQGESTVSACLKHKDPFAYWPTAKILLESNSIPHIDTTDRAFMNRLQLIEFPVQITRERMDFQLREKLQVELDALFTWAVEGAMIWRAEGLRQPRRMLQVVETVRRENISADNLDPFIAECCDLGPGMGCWLPELYKVYQAYCERHRSRPMRYIPFSKRICQRDGVTRVSQKGQRHTIVRLHGICPKEEPMRATTGKDAQYKDHSDDD